MTYFPKELIVDKRQAAERSRSLDFPWDFSLGAKFDGKEMWKTWMQKGQCQLGKS